MRIKEWFGWHFPEMAKIVTDNEVFVKLLVLMQVKENLNEELLP
jgi:nucleolar protein 56